MYTLIWFLSHFVLYFNDTDICMSCQVSVLANYITDSVGTKNTISIFFNDLEQFTKLKKLCFTCSTEMSSPMKKFVTMCFDESPTELVLGMLVYGRLPQGAKGFTHCAVLNPRPADIEGHGYGRIATFKMNGVCIDFGGSGLYFYTCDEVLERFTLFKDAPDDI